MSTIHVSTIFYALIVTWFCYQFVAAIHSCFFSSLSQIPGPKLNAITRFALTWHKLVGDENHYFHRLHLKYGKAVRVAPTEVSYIDAQAWKDIYGRYSTTKSGVKSGQFQKDPTFYGYAPPGFVDMLGANDADHSRVRRNFSNGFSDKSLRAQVPLVQKYVSQLISVLDDAVDDGRLVNMLKLLNFTTFDVMADLTSGDPLGCLESGEDHPWMRQLFALFRVVPVIQEVAHFPWLFKLIEKSTPKSIHEENLAAYKFARSLVENRLARAEDRADLWGVAIARGEKTEFKLSREEMDGNARLFMTAGTETTAASVSGLTYHLLANPDKLELLTRELRSAFATVDDIDLEKLVHLPYLNACIEEGLRVYPPVPSYLPRVVPKGGATVCGQYLPEDTAVFIHHYALNFNPDNFKNPDKFRPERWMNDPEYAQDNRSCFQPFSNGPRNCLGKNLAYVEMRLLLANIFWRFDLSLGPGMDSWPNQRVFVVWEKKPLELNVNRAKNYALS